MLLFYVKPQRLHQSHGKTLRQKLQQTLSCSQVLVKVKEVFPSECKTLDTGLTAFWSIRDSLHIGDEEMFDVW